MRPAGLCLELYDALNEGQGRHRESWAVRRAGRGARGEMKPEEMGLALADGERHKACASRRTRGADRGVSSSYGSRKSEPVPEPAPSVEARPQATCAARSARATLSGKPSAPGLRPIADIGVRARRCEMASRS